MARPAGLESATPDLEELWHHSEAAFVPASDGGTHATYPPAPAAPNTMSPKAYGSWELLLEHQRRFGNRPRMWAAIIG
jgi:hypothetical protein